MIKEIKVGQEICVKDCNIECLVEIIKISSEVVYYIYLSSPSLILNMTFCRTLEKFYTKIIDKTPEEYKLEHL